MRDLARNVLASAAIFFACTAAWAAGPVNRILTRPGAPDTTLEHSVSGRLRSSADLGPASPDRTLPAVTLHFSRTAAQQAAIDKLLVTQQNPQSPLFHKWLTPAQFRQQFGLSDADLARVSSWLSSQGLTVTGSSLTNTSITASGSVAQIEKALGVSIHNERYQGEQFFANVNDPVLPSAIASVVRGITGLSNFRLHPRVVLQPKFTSALTGAHYLTPGDINTIYDLKPLLASAVNGTGVTIAVMGQTAISLADVAAFRSAASLPANAPTVSYTPSNLGVSSADLIEAQLDVEWSGAIAPNATISYVAVTPDNNGAFAALTNSIANTANPAKILSISYGECENTSDASVIYSYDQYFQQAGLQGQTIIGPGGDSGATDCDYTSSIAADGLSVDFPASSPNVTGVGGLMFDEGSGNYWASAPNSSTDAVSSALSYIPESVWNETSSSTGLAAGGGGASVFFPKPNWQVGTGVPNDLARDVPDVALDAAVNHDGYLICSAGSCVNGFRASDSTLNVVGGTSVGVPIFAGMLALVEQKTASTGGLGNINPKLYGLASQFGSQVFHDTTQGNNDSPCVIGSPNCNTSPIGYAATVGYDLASGWGSLDGNNFANFFASATPTGTTATTGSAVALVSVSLASNAASCGISSGSVNFNVSVASAGTGAAATGTVQLFVDGKVVGSPVPLTSGAATLTLNTAALASISGFVSGGHSINVGYSGDNNYASSRGNLSPSLSPVPSQIYVPSFIDVALTGAPDFALTPCQPTLNVASGSSASTPITLTGLNGFSGPVTLTASTDGNLQGSFAFSTSPVTVSSSGTATSTFTFNAYYNNSSTASLRGGSGQGLHPSTRRGLYETGAGGVALASLLFLTLPRRRRYIGVLTLIISAGVIGSAGCSGGVTTLPSNNPTPPNTTGTTPNYYIVNITASGTNSLGQSLIHTSYLTLNVQ